MRLITKLPVLFGVILLSACSTTSLTGTTSSSAEKLNSYIADKSCDATFQCKVIPVGERLACGGPSQYLIYSTKMSDEDKVLELAEQVTAQEKASNNLLAPSDICQQVLPIQSLCVSNTCEAFTIKN